MKTFTYYVPVVLAACLLQACSSLPPDSGLAVTPVFKADNSAGVDAPALYQLGRYHQQRGELAAADTAFARSIALDPHQLEARNARAALLASQGKLDAAVVLLQELVADFPGAVQPRNNLGYAYHLQGREDVALTTLQQALALDPAHAQTRANLALLHPSPPPAVAAVVAAATPDAAPSARMEVVQLAPNEFRLQAKAASRELPAQQFQIVNGHGVRGGGERVRVLLASQGIAAGRVVNQRGHYQRTTVLEYLPTQQRQANAVLAALQGRARLLPVRALPQGLALRLVLGRDHAAQLAALDPASAIANAPQFAALDRVARPHFNQE
ncbi:hypothetical protein GTP56_23140 [Duganella sp. FT134W]|uniref:LytR/CpsA/Psr regulator C-terminal domain-containing protein n=1 Tax=Duganella margarita TaxID=2692170 RepID=A0A7X4KJZ6_9BURK|nr:LytR C-terminal domain-containing protein [Duganella margarita]MYM75068.1 hypothetical protein [Duganella margarita]